MDSEYIVYMLASVLIVIPMALAAELGHTGMAGIKKHKGLAVASALVIIAFVAFAIVNIDEIVKTHQRDPLSKPKCDGWRLNPISALKMAAGNRSGTAFFEVFSRGSSEGISLHSTHSSTKIDALQN